MRKFFTRYAEVVAAFALMIAPITSVVKRLKAIVNPCCMPN